jgi:chemotaxis protein methyltransferase CheR
LKENSDYDFSEYAPKSFQRRVEKVLEDFGMDIFELIDEINKGDQNFIQKVVNNLTVNTTELFRDPKVWQAIRYRILPKLRNNDVIDIWHPGCSSGQEVYSMLILLNEEGLLDKVNIYGTDINTDALEQARKELKGLHLVAPDSAEDTAKLRCPHCKEEILTSKEALLKGLRND